MDNKISIKTIYQLVASGAGAVVCNALAAAGCGSDTPAPAYGRASDAAAGGAVSTGGTASTGGARGGGGARAGSGGNSVGGQATGSGGTTGADAGAATLAVVETPLVADDGSAPT